LKLFLTMFAVTGKIWSIDSVKFQEKHYLRMVIHKKRKDKVVSMCFLIFKEPIIEDYNKRMFGNADYIEIKFYIKANEYKDRYYNNLFVDKITLLRRSKNASTLNMFNRTDENLSNF